ncbi:hypothetical protein FQR65_LT08041 [Abscondita terminalis]|nr:hypothetical protein FQR65_LT08041 [Abscondita terminalis]
MSALQKQNRGEDFFYYEKLALKCVGVWRTKDDSVGYKIYASAVIAMFTCVYYIILAFDVFTQNLYDAMDSWVVFMGFSIEVFVIFSWMVNANNFINLLQIMGKKYFVRNFYRYDSFEHSAISKWYRYKNIYNATFLTTLLISVVLQFIYTLTLRYIKSDPNEWKLRYGSISFLNFKYSPVFEFLCVYQHLAVICGTVSLTTIFNIVVGTLYFIATQFIILQNDIKMIVLDDDKHLVDNEKLKNFVDNHVRLLKLTNKVSEIFSKTIFAIFLGFVSASGLEMYLISVLPVKNLSNVTFFLEISSGLFILFLICAAANNIDNESIRLAKAIYEVNFVGTSLYFQKSLTIILRQAQKPIEIKSVGIMNVSFITFTAILRIIYSAYAMLKTVQSNNL